MSIGVPIKVLHEAESHIATCEIYTDEIHCGKLLQDEDNMNCPLFEVTVTYRDGSVVLIERLKTHLCLDDKGINWLQVVGKVLYYVHDLQIKAEVKEKLDMVVDGRVGQDPLDVK